MPSFAAEVNHHLRQFAAARTDFEHHFSSGIKQRQMSDDALKNDPRLSLPVRIGAPAHFVLAQGIILGHSSAVTSEIYAEIDREKAKEMMAKMG